MTNYWQPDGPQPFTYKASAGVLKGMRTGDFFKSHACRRFQRFEGELISLSKTKGQAELCCSRCAVTLNVSRRASRAG